MELDEAGTNLQSVRMEPIEAGASDRTRMSVRIRMSDRKRASGRLRMTER